MYKRLFLFFIFFFFSTFSFSSDTPEKYLKKAKGFLEENRFEPAFEMAQLAYVAAENTLSPVKQINFNNFMGKMYILQEKYEEAEGCFLKTLEIIKTNKVKKAKRKKCKVKNLYSIVLMKLQKFDLAIMSLKETVSLYKSTYGKKSLLVSIPLINLGEAYRLKKDYINAEDPYKEALEIRVKDKKNSDAVLLAKSALADVYCNSDKKDEARAILNEITALEINASSVAVDIYDNIALAFESLGDEKMAMEYRKKASATAAEFLPENHSRNKNN